MRTGFSRLRHLGQLALSLLVLTPIGPAYASTTSATMAVSATVEQACNLNVRPLRFGTFRSDAPVAEADSSLAVACTPETAFVVSLDDGQHRAGGQRRLANAGGGGFLAYDLYSDPARTRRWGAGLAESVSGQVEGAEPVMIPIYGRIEAGSAEAGAYSDVVTVTVSF